MRRREITPGFWENEQIQSLPCFARLLYIGLWQLADRNGRLMDKPMIIQGKLFPNDRDIDCRELLASLEAEGFIVRYEAEGKKLIWIPAFLSHQRPHPNEAVSDLPAHPNDIGIPKVNQRNTKGVPLDSECQAKPSKPSKPSELKSTSARATSHTAAELQAAKADDDQFQPKPYVKTPYGMTIATHTALRAKFDDADIGEFAEECRERQTGVKLLAWWLKCLTTRQQEREAQAAQDAAERAQAQANAEAQIRATEAIIAPLKTGGDPCPPEVKALMAKAMSSLKSKSQGASENGAGSHTAAKFGDGAGHARGDDHRATIHRDSGRNPDAGGLLPGRPPQDIPGDPVALPP